MTETMEQTPEVHVRRWLEEAVIGLNFCPFAAGPYRDGAVRIAVKASDGFETAVDRTIDEAEHLLESEPEEVSTTLVVFPEALGEFEAFLDAAAVVRELLSRSGLDGVLQVATFHPDYRFAGTEPDALENFTNRAPLPVLHLIREAEVSEAVRMHPEPEGIPQRNIERLEEMGRREVEALFGQWMDGMGDSDGGR